MYQQHENGEISAQQSFVILLNIIIGTGILGLSRRVAQVSQQDAWISVLMNGIFVSLIVLIIVYTISKFPQYNFLQYTSYLLSRPLGYFITIAYVLYGLLFTTVLIRFLCEMIYTWLLPLTPLWVLSLVTLLTVLNMTRKGLTTLARFSEVMAFMLIPFALLIFVGLPQASFINLRPIGGSGIGNILKGIFPTFFTFAGYEVLLVYYPYISNKQKPIMKQSALAIIIITLFYATAVMAQIALYGSQEIQQVLYPSISSLMVVDFPVIERMEIFFTIFWVFTVLATIGLYFLSTCILLQNVFSNKKAAFFVYLLSPVVYFLSLIPQNIAEVMNFVDIVGKLNLFFGLLLPLILLIMYFLRGGRGKNYEKNF